MDIAVFFIGWFNRPSLDTVRLGVRGIGHAQGVPPGPVAQQQLHGDDAEEVPIPLAWTEAAVTCFLNASFPQEGQVFSGVSDSFCKTSLAKPQSSHR